MHKYMKIFIVIIIAMVFKNFLHFLLDDDTKQQAQQEPTDSSKLRVFKPDELVNSKQLLLAILGSVYDVSKGEKHYKPGGSYDFFVG